MNWRYLHAVDVALAMAWLVEAGDSAWARGQGETWAMVSDGNLPMDVIQPIIDAVDIGGRVGTVLLTRLIPGQSHRLHVDQQKDDWLTRIHVPITTNPFCLMVFEDERVHFEVGKAYGFNTLAMHGASNLGDTDRVHLMFDVHHE